MDELKTEPAGWGEILWGWKHYLLLPLILFCAFTLILYIFLGIHVHVTPLSVFSGVSIQEAINDSPNYAYPANLLVYTFLLSFFCWQYRKWNKG